MGGRALKTTFTRRYERNEFDLISVELLDLLKKDFKNVVMPLFYKNKQSFGDADIIISTDGFNSNLRDYIVETFKPTEIFHNGNCWSFDYKEFQIDLITTSDEHFSSLSNYMNFNDLGNFIGKIAMGFGCRYGQEGFWFEHYFKGINLGKIYLSKDTEKVFKFLDLSYNKYLQGFDELEDIFKFISSSKYFNWNKVQLENNNKVNRDRDKKRTTYQSFLKWIDENVRDDEHAYQSLSDKTEYYKMIDEFFPEANLFLEIRRVEYEYCKSLYIKAKFNGGELMRRYSLEGKEIGDAINSFKKAIEGLFENETYEDYIISTPVNEIYSDFETFYKPVTKVS